MSATDPKEQVRRTKNLAAGFALSHVIKSEAYIDDCIHRLKERLVVFARSEEPVHLDEWFNYIAFDVIGEVVFLEADKDLSGSIANPRLLVPYVMIAGFFRTFHRLTVGNPFITEYNLMPTQNILDTTLRATEARKKNPYLSVNPRVVHYSRELYGEDPGVYNPYRWNGPQAKDIEKYFVAFGAGYNSCQGRSIAQLEIFKAAATLLGDFDFKQVNPVQKWKYEASFAALPPERPCYVSETSR
ncbi:cytochrome P450 [Macroventuria anomochaeta]|uniref:Cytochrome P450 n=1 Tax=Macroventuria anomochaeta TaxID=301207 RepID=A0ACB6SIH6_9PLEO|nr:cytochrome P450 [Macroventuria anomochaeta]KAF2633782.1 cytochrome P450 [Macroventuria anomochaeta]